MGTIKRVNLNSKAGQEIAKTINDSYTKYGYRLLDECYARPSFEKRSIFKSLNKALRQSPITMLYKECGIVSHNNNHFSVGLKTLDNEHYIYITKDYIYYIDEDHPPIGIWNI